MLARVQLRVAVCFLVTGALVAGCGTATPPPPPPEATPEAPQFPVAKTGESKLSGKITHNGQPLVAGRLVFYAHDGVVPTVGMIMPDGKYLADQLPEGELAVCVLTDPAGALPFPTVQGPPSVGGPPTGPPMGGPPMGGPPGAAPPMPPKGPPGGGAPKGPPGGKGPPDPLGPPGAGIPSPSEVIAPAGIPPTMLASLKDFTVPADQKELYTALHKKYGLPSKTNPLKVNVRAGENTRDITIP